MITIYIGKPNKKAEAEPLDAELLGIAGVVETVQSYDLFGEKKTYRIEGLESEDLRKEFLNSLESIENAPNDVVTILDKLLVADRRKAEAFATIQETKAKAEPKEAFNAFALGNALATGDKKKIWTVFQELLVHEDEMEKTHGLVWWKLKDMMQKKGIFTDIQLKNMARDLVAAYHESRLGGIGMQERLELFFLTLPTQNK